MIKKTISLIFLILLLTNCVKSNLSTFGKGVTIGFDPRTVGMQIDDTLMQKSLVARLTLAEKKYFLYIQVEILDGRIFLTGKVEKPEEKIKITKMAWETRGVRSVKNAIEIRGQSDFKSTGKDVLITAQLRTALLFNKLVKSGNYTLETINKTIYIFGIAMNDEEKEQVISEAKKIYDVKKVVPTIYLVSELSRNKI
jgi:osmotically-inducible protein OsmY|tara:strand:+ start:92 stop:682 length:591 start_codon:yes stop_codon:yes gene_type:complete